MKDTGFGAPGRRPRAFPTAADALRRVDTRDGVPPERRRRMRSALQFLPRLYGRPLEAIPLDPEELGRRFPKAAEAFAHGLERSTLYSYRTAIRTVLWMVGVTDPPRRRADPLPPDWDALRRRLPDKYLSIWLQSFMGFCADAGIHPNRVEEEATLAAYLDHLAGPRRLARDPFGKVQKVARAWNRAADTVPGWPAVRLRAPARNRNYSLPFTGYPASFQADVEEFRRRLVRGDGFGGDDGSSGEGGDGVPRVPDFLCKPASPATVENRLRDVRAAAAALLHSGTPVERITGLATLVEARNMVEILDWHWRRAGKKRSGHLGNIADTLRVVAKRHVRLPGPALAEVVALAKGAQPRRHRRMTPKNERRLLQLEDPGNEAQLLHLPEPLLVVAGSLLAKGRRHDAAWLAGVAVAGRSSCTARCG